MRPTTISFPSLWTKRMNKPSLSRKRLKKTKRRREFTLNSRTWRTNSTKSIGSTMSSMILRSNFIKSTLTTSKRISLIWNKRSSLQKWEERCSRRQRKRCNKILIVNKHRLRKGLIWMLRSLRNLRRTLRGSKGLYKWWRKGLRRLIESIKLSTKWRRILSQNKMRLNLQLTSKLRRLILIPSIRMMEIWLIQTIISLNSQLL